VAKSAFAMMPAASRHAAAFAIAVTLGACGSDHAAVHTGDTGDASAGASGSAGAAATGGQSGAGGASSNGTGGAGGDPSVCHTSNLSSAPLPCLQDFTHIKAKYGTRCTTDGGYQATCAPYDALVFQSATDFVWCYYDHSTGNLIGARDTADASGSGGTCVQFDTTFAEPAVSSCMSAAGETCASP
jgi:hypothetical protein